MMNQKMSAEGGRAVSWRFLAVAGLCVGLTLVVSACGQAQGGAAASDTVATVESIQGTLADGSNFRAVMPEPWNGTLVLDLDFANRLDARRAPSSSG